jgi:hypothetical protein
MPEFHSNKTMIRLQDPPPDKSLHALFRPYVYRGLGYDIYNPDESDDDA